MCSRGSWIRRLSQNCPPLHVGSPGRRRPPTRQSPALPLSSFPAQVTRAYTGTRAHKQGHTRTRGHMNTRRDKGTGVNERARANKSARAPVHTCTPALRLGYAGTHKQTRTPTQKCPHPVPAPGAPASPLPAPRPLLQRPSPVSGLPLTWRRCRRTRAPRAHPPGGPGVGARSRMAALAPAESRAGRGRRGRRGPLSGGGARQVCLLSPCVWESGKARPPEPRKEAAANSKSTLPSEVRCREQKPEE